MSFQCPFCPRIFSTKSAYSQHKNRCVPPDDDSDNRTNDNDMSLDNEEFSQSSHIEEVKKYYNSLGGFF